MKSEVTAMTKELVMTDKTPMPSRIPYQIPKYNEIITKTVNDHITLALFV